jgi:hypothetical protein
LQQKSVLRSTLIIGFIAHTALICLAALYYQERTIFSDIAFQTFLMINEGGLQTMVGRFISVATHWLPWTLINFGVPLKGVLIGFSLSFTLWYAAAFLICGQVLKQWKLALTLLLFSTLMVKDSFYWITSELPQGMALLFIFFAFLLKIENFGHFKWFHWVIWLFLSITLVYAHPMLLFPFVFVGLFLLIDKKEKRDFRKMILASLGLFLSIVFIKTKVLPLNWYDAMSMEKGSEIWQRFPHYFDLVSNRDFLKWCLHDYYWLPILWLVNWLFFSYRKEFLKAVLCLVFPIFYLLLVNVSFANGDKQFYIEALYLPLAVMVALPFVWDVLSFEKQPKWAFGLISLILITSLVRINHAHKHWTERLNWEKNFCATHPENQKLIIDEKDTPMQLLGMSWGSSYEFLILSALENPDKARLFIIDEDPKRFEKEAKNGDIFLGEFKNYPLESFDKRYFRVKNKGGYDGL